MALLADLTELRARVAASGGRLEKRRLVALYLRALPPDDLARAVTYLSGRAFPASDPRVLNVRGLPAPAPGASGEPLTLADVARAFGEVAGASGPGARRMRVARRGVLAAPASLADRDTRHSIIIVSVRMILSARSAAPVNTAVVRTHF